MRERPNVIVCLCDGFDLRHLTALYYGLTTWLDESRQRENTLIVFMADHGEMLGDHGIFTKGPFFYDPAVRIPLIKRWGLGL
jgi:hypothetical protein